MTLAEIIANANANSEFIPGMSSNEIFFGTSTNDRLTDVIADVAEACQDKADSDHIHTGYAPSSHSHEGYAPAEHSHNYAASNHSHYQSQVEGLTEALAGKADLNSDGKIPASQMPDHWDNVYYGYMGDGFRDAVANVRLAPTIDTLYVDINTGKIYYYSNGYKEAGCVTAAQIAAWNSKADGNHGHSYNDLSDKPTIPTIPASLPADGGNADTVDGKHASDFAPASHSHTGNIIVEQTGSPYMRLKLADSSREARVYKNASTTADYGLTLADYDADGAKDSLIFCRANALAQKLYLNVQNADNTRSLYYLYGEHHKPTLEEIGGGTITGDVNVNGVLRVNGQQSFYFQTSTNSQTIGTNNASGGTTICCGANADVNVNGAHMKTPTVVPKTNNAYLCGNANFRWAGIYSTAAVNVSSDERLKRDIAPMDGADLAAFIEKLNVVSYNYKDDAEDAKARIGLVAQDVQRADADLSKFFVTEDETGMLGLTPADLVFPLIEAFKAQSKRIAELEAKLEAK